MDGEESTGAMLGTSITVGFLNAMYYVTIVLVFGVLGYLFVVIWDTATGSSHAPGLRSWVNKKVGKSRGIDRDAPTPKKRKGKKGTKTASSSAPVPTKAPGVPATAPSAPTGAPRPAAA